MNENVQDKSKENDNNIDKNTNKKRKREALREQFERLKKKKLEIDKQVEKKERIKIKKKEKKQKEKQDKLIQEYNNIKKEKKIKTQIDDILPYIEPNKQLKDVDQGRFAEKSKLELKIDKAINEGNFELAEELNDELIIQQKEKVYNEALECKNFVESKNLEIERRKKRKKKRLVWGFDSKQRWETKGNM